MKLIELHILQSFPVSCLNRDDVGAPKTAVFGGVNRARISSQCLKRAVREMAQEMTPALFAGNRSRLIVEPLASRLEKHGVAGDKALEAAKQVGDYLAVFDAEAEKKGKLQVKTLMFLSPAEMDQLASSVAEVVKTGGKEKDIAKGIAAACKKAQLKDAADIAIFGRMVASDHTLTLEGAGMFSHALSTHKAQNDIDFFAAVDDLQKAEESGAGMTGTVEFTSATYYRYAALNLDLLWKEDHLKALPQAERRVVVDTFLRAALMAVPGARKNSMNANTLPGYVLGIVKEKGYPIQLVNAFEKPATPKSGLMETSREAMQEHYASLKKTWGLPAALEITIPDVGLDDFCKGILKHV